MGIRWSIAVLAVVVLAGCGQTSGGGAGTSAAADPLDGRTLVVGDGSTVALSDPATVRLAFADGQVSGSLGCNTVSGPYALSDGRLTLERLAMTEMACEPAALMTQESTLGTWLAKGADVTVDGDAVRFTGADQQTLVMTEQSAEETVPLEGTLWALSGLEDGETASSVPADVTSTVRIADGQLAVQTGCNSGGAEVTVDEARLAVGPLRLTKKACEPDAMSVEAAVLAVLEGEVPYTIEGSNLRLEGDGRALVYTASSTGG